MRYSRSHFRVVSSPDPALEAQGNWGWDPGNETNFELPGRCSLSLLRHAQPRDGAVRAESLLAQFNPMHS